MRFAGPTLALGLVLASACHGQTVRMAQKVPFHFQAPGCQPAKEPSAPAPSAVDVKFLGAAGLYVRWGDDSILLGPYFSNPGAFRAQFGRWRADRSAIDRGLADIDPSKVAALFTGHAHYDHLGDFPPILEKATEAHVFVNRSGANTLAPYAERRTTALEEVAGRWTWLTRGGRRLPIRFHPVVSSHAPQIGGYLWAGRSVETPWKEPWNSRHFRDLQVGQTFALVIDLLADDLATVRYRFYYQDSANRQGIGEPPPFPDGHPYDLAVLCIASYDKAPGQPAAILKALRPRHVLVTHYDDFFRPQTEPVRFVSLLTDAKVEKYLTAIADTLQDSTAAAGGPANDDVCGPSGPRWTMPLPGEWMRFEAPISPPSADTRSKG